MAAPLNKIRILDMTRVLAGPWATQLFGDYGADVIKIERPGQGDDTRRWGPPWLDGPHSDSAYFSSANRNKRSVSIDFSSSEGLAIVRALATKADVIVENYKVATLARYGLGPKELMADNAKLIYCSISAFGQEGKRAAEPGYDAVVQASAGLMSITGSADGGPEKVGVAISDIMAGMYAATAIFAALHERNSTGRGQYIDVPLYDSQVAWLANQNANFLFTGKSPERMGTAHPNLVPYQVFPTADGEIMLAVGNDRQFAACCNVLEITDVSNDLRFQRMCDRIANRAELIKMLEQEFVKRPTKVWIQRLKSAGVPAGPVNDIAEVLTNEYAKERQLVREVVNGADVSVPIVANPVNFSDSAISYDRAPPLLGEHTDEVLREWLGYSDADIMALKKKTHTHVDQK